MSASPSGPPTFAQLPETPLVSVVIPAYNYAHYLPQAIESAFAQDWPADRLEVIVVDDGSTDDTPAVMAGFGDRIVGLHRENGGLNAATETGMRAATGEVITFLDADDLWPADRTAALVRGLREHPDAALSWGDMTVIDDDGSVRAESFRADTGIGEIGSHPYPRLIVNNAISAGAMMIRTAVRELVLPFSPSASHQDWWIVTRLTPHYAVASIPESVNLYRMHGANMNLGATMDRDRHAALIAGELPFRRLMLGEARPGPAPLSAWVSSIALLDEFVRRVAGHRSRSRASVLGVTEEDRVAAHEALSAASAALDGGDLPQTACHLIGAIGSDPLWDEPRDLLSALMPHVEEAELAAAKAEVHGTMRAVGATA